jgi:phosphate uptake regulator
MADSHTSRDFEAELRELRSHLLTMGARCERSVRIALESFITKSVDLAVEV